MIATYTTLTANIRGHGDSNELAAKTVEATGSSSTATPRPWRFSVSILQRLCEPARLAAQESQLAQVAATLPPLVKQLSQLHDLLAALSGRFPAQVAEEKFDLSSLTLPGELR